jgi:hypothetical protein
MRESSRGTGASLSRCLDGRAWAAVLIVLLLLPSVNGSLAQKSPPSQPPANAVPTFDALPHQPLPKGEFEGWCGMSDKMMMRVDDKIEIYDGLVKLTPYGLPNYMTLQCSGDSQKMAFIDEKAGLATEMDIPSATMTRTLASFSKDLSNPIISFSPDLKNFVTNSPLTVGPWATEIKAIRSKQEDARNFRWNRESSEFFYMSGSVSGAPIIVSAFDVQQRKIGSGKIPDKIWFSDAWFAGSDAVYLFLGLESDKSGLHRVMKCRIREWKCETIVSDVITASAGGNGLLGMVRPIGKYMAGNETITYPPKVLVELRDGTSKVIARQTFRSVERRMYHLYVAPSGQKAILRWYGNDAPDCSPEDRERFMCDCGIIIDLSGRIK